VVPLRLAHIRAFLLTDPADIERVLVTDHRKFVKPLWLRTPAVRRLLGDGLVNSDGDDWKRQHDECQPAFHPSLMSEYGSTISRIAAEYTANWAAGETRNIQHDMARITLQIVAETMFGGDVAGQSAEIGDAMDTVMESFAAPSSLFGLIPLPPSPRESYAMRKLDALVDRLIDGNTSCPHLLSRLGGTRKQLRDQVKTFLAAGHESSALALTWAFWLLDSHPETDARLSEELSRVLDGRHPEPSDYANLTYTQAVIKESLRLYPPLWITGRKAIQPIELSGVNIPAGSLLLTSQWAVQRLPRYFQDPDKFRPERWLNAETTSLPRFAYFPFGGGPRICIGQGFAMMESVLLLATIAQQFKLKSAKEEAVIPQATMTLRPSNNLSMTLVSR
jgi:cytochrome P450